MLLLLVISTVVCFKSIDKDREAASTDRMQEQEEAGAGAEQEQQRSAASLVNRQDSSTGAALALSLETRKKQNKMEKGIEVVGRVLWSRKRNGP